MTPTFLNPPLHFTKGEFRAYVASLRWGAWKPRLPYAHNTGVPSLEQWLAMAPTPQQRWTANLDSYYRGLGWHAGPHCVACPDYIWALCEQTLPGVAESCSNSVAWAIEHVGDYREGGDSLDSAAAQAVWDNGAWAIACVAEAVGWGDLGDYAFNERGLHFHHDCAQDHHACPGPLVTKRLLSTKIAACRAELRGKPMPPVEPPAPKPAHLFDLSTATGLQQALRALDFQVTVDGDWGPETQRGLDAFRKIAGLPQSGGHALSDADKSSLLGVID